MNTNNPRVYRHMKNTLSLMFTRVNNRVTSLCREVRPILAALPKDERRALINSKEIGFRFTFEHIDHIYRFDVTSNETHGIVLGYFSRTLEHGESTYDAEYELSILEHRRYVGRHHLAHVAPRKTAISYSAEMIRIDEHIVDPRAFREHAITQAEPPPEELADFVLAVQIFEDDIIDGLMELCLGVTNNRHKKHLPISL